MWICNWSCDSGQEKVREMGSGEVEVEVRVSGSGSGSGRLKVQRCEVDEASELRRFTKRTREVFI